MWARCVDGSLVLAQFSPTQVGQWGALADKLTTVGLLASVLIFGAVALHKRWIVLGWVYKDCEQEKLMWRSAYESLQGTTTQATAANKEFAQLVGKVVRQ
jgi:hypothetical protein